MVRLHACEGDNIAGRKMHCHNVQSSFLSLGMKILIQQCTELVAVYTDVMC